LDKFRLTDDAVLDVDEIWLYLLWNENLETADRIVTDLFKGFCKLGDNPRLGHGRADLTRMRLLFYKVFSYLIICDPEGRPLPILAVLHGKRNISRILKQRQSPVM
jgi:plasmid stabilization system protein ParE